MPRDAAKEAFCFLFELISTPRHVVGGQGPLLALPQIYMNAKADSPIFSMTSAVSLLFFSRFHKSSVHRDLAEKSFGEAISRLRRAIGDPVAVRQDDTLMTMTLCGTWEAFRANIQSLATWGEHSRGRFAVAQLRGKEMQTNRTSQLLLRAILHDAIISKINQRLPVELPFEIDEEPEYSLTGMQPPGHALSWIGVKIGDLRVRAWMLRAPTMTFELAQKIMALIQDAKTVDQDLIAWQKGLPESWGFEERRYADCADEKLMESEYWPGPVYSYYDFTTASSWSIWRAFRLYVNVIIFNCLERLVPPSECSRCKEYQRIVAILQEIVDDICYTLPFQQGLEDPLCQYAESVSPLAVAMKAPGEQSNSTSSSTVFVQNTPEAHRKMTEHFSAFNVYLPLFVAQGVPTVPERQRRWIKARYLDQGERSRLNQVVAAGRNFMPDDYSNRKVNIVDYAPPPFEPYVIDDTTASGIDSLSIKTSWPGSEY